MAYQNVYDITPLSKAQPKLAFLPVTVDCGSVKLTLLESDLEAYPGMFVQSQQGKYGLKGVFAPYPAKTDFYPWRKQEYVTETTDFISRSRGSRSIRGVCWPLRRRIRICRSTTWSMPWLLPTVSVIPHG
mgnify:FL=1